MAKRLSLRRLSLLLSRSSDSPRDLLLLFRPHDPGGQLSERVERVLSNTVRVL